MRPFASFIHFFLNLFQNLLFIFFDNFFLRFAAWFVSLFLCKIWLQSFSGLLDYMRKDIDIKSDAPTQLLRDSHVDFLWKSANDNTSYVSLLHGYEFFSCRSILWVKAFDLVESFGVLAPWTCWERWDGSNVMQIHDFLDWYFATRKNYRVCQKLSERRWRFCSCTGTSKSCASYT